MAKRGSKKQIKAKTVEVPVQKKRLPNLKKSYPQSFSGK